MRSGPKARSCEFDPCASGENAVREEARDREDGERIAKQECRDGETAAIESKRDRSQEHGEHGRRTLADNEERGSILRHPRTNWRHAIEPNFFRIHVTAGLVLSPIVAAIFYASQGANPVSYTDSLFTCVSALTLTGLTSTLINPLTTWQQVILYLLMQLGSYESVGLITLLVRRHSYSKRFKELKAMIEDGKDVESECSGESEGQTLVQRLSSRRNEFNDPLQPASRGGFPTPIGFVARGLAQRIRFRRNHRTPQERNYLPEGVLLGRNSRFVGVNSKQAKLSVLCLELSAMNMMIWILLGSWLGLQLIAVITWAPWFSSGAFASTFAAEGYVNRTWFSFFEAASMHNNVGLSLLDSSLSGFATAWLLLLPGAFLMLSGYTMLPLVLRLVTWTSWKLSPKDSETAKVLWFLLEHPRRVTIFMFPIYETIALSATYLLLIAIDWVCWFVLEIGNPAFFQELGRGNAVGVAFVQSVAVRSAGFYVVSPGKASPSEQILWMFMLLLALYPFALCIRATNVYEERALGLREEDEHNLRAGLHHLSKQRGYIQIHLGSQLAYDVGSILFSIWLITIIERDALENPADSSITVWSLIFECASAYSCQGFSFGAPNSNTSLSGSLRNLSKLVLIATMIRGRTRGLPISLDRAILTSKQLRRYGDPPESAMAHEPRAAKVDRDVERAEGS